MAALLKPFGNLLSPKRTVPTGRLRIDWSHPLAQGLLVCYLPGTSLGMDITGQVPNLTFGLNQTNVTAQAMGPEGPGLNTLKNGGFGHAYLFGTATSPLKTWSSLSLYWRGFIGPSSDNPPNDTDLFGITYDNVSTPPFSVVNINTNATNQFSIRWNSAGTNNNTTNTALSQNAVNSIGGTLQVGGNGVAYQSGVAISSVSFGAGAPQSSATSQIDIGVYYNQTGRFSNSVTFLACAWNRVLSASEMAWLDAEPYAFLLPDEGEMPALFVAAAAGAIALSGRTVIAFGGKLSPTLALPLSGRATDQVRGKAGPALAVPLLGKSSVQSEAKAPIALGLSLSGRVGTNVSAKSQTALRITLAALSKAVTAGKGTPNLGVILVALSSRSLSAIAGKMQPRIAIPIVARGASAVSGRVQAALGVTLAGRSAIAAPARSSGGISISLSAVSKAATAAKGIPNLAVGLVALSSRSLSSMSSRGAPRISIVLSALSKSVLAAKGLPSLAGLITNIIANRFIAARVPLTTALAGPRNRIATGTSIVSMAPDLTPPIQVGEQEYATFDFGPALATGTSITAVVSVICTAVSGPDASPSSRLLGTALIAPSPGTLAANAAVRQLFGTAVGATRYRLQCLAATSDGQILSDTVHWNCDS